MLLPQFQRDCLINPVEDTGIELLRISCIKPRINIGHMNKERARSIVWDFAAGIISPLLIRIMNMDLNFEIIKERKDRRNKDVYFPLKLYNIKI